MKYDFKLPNFEMVRVALAAGLQEGKVTPSPHWCALQKKHKAY